MLILIGVFTALRSDRWRGTKLLWFLLVYGLGRAATDLLRGDAAPGVIGPLTPTQLICLASAVLALAALLLIRRAKRGATLVP
jgi:prolipoprotein diacylglyceryltransferase